MRQKHLLTKLMLLVAVVLMGAGTAVADTLTEGFETKGASTTYNSTVTISKAESDCGMTWTIYYGTVSTNDKISGTNSAQMRWYASAVDNYPYIMTTTAIDGLSNVSLKARTNNLNVKMDISYSADGETWTVGKTYEFEATGVGEEVSLNIPSGNKYVKFGVSSSSTAPSSGNYKLGVDDVVFTYSDTATGETPTWELDPASATVMAGATTTLQLTTNYDGTLSFKSDDESIATVSYDSSTKVITVTGVAAGVTTITATGAATSTYKAVSKTIDVTVNHSELASNLIDEIGPLGYSYFGFSPTGGDTYVQPTTASTDITDANGVGFSVSIGENQNTYPRFDATYMRFYQKNTLTITAPAGSYITKIVFVEPSTNKSWSGVLATTADGDYVSETKSWYANVENITSVTFTNDATKRIGSIQVYLMVTSVTKTVGTAGWATYAPEYAVEFAAGEAYIIELADNTDAVLTEVSDVPAGTPVLLKGEGEHTMNVIAASTTDVSDNCLKVSDGTVTKDDGVYVLANGNYGVGFYLWMGDSPLSAGKIYMEPNVTPSRSFIALPGETTGIANVNANANANLNEVYDLQGRRVAQPTKGLYIKNGKKVILK